MVGCPAITTHRNCKDPATAAGHRPRFFWASSSAYIVLPYGPMSDGDASGTIIGTNMRHQFTSDTLANMSLAVGDVALLQPAGALPGTVIHTVNPTLVRYGTGPAATLNTTQAAMVSTVTTPANAVVETFRPVYDITGAGFDATSAQILIPKNHLYGAAFTSFNCLFDEPMYDRTTGWIAWHTPAKRQTFSVNVTAPSAADTDITPTAPLYTGVFGGTRPTVIPGTDGRVTITNDIFTPLFPPRPAGPDAQPVPPFGSFGTTVRDQKTYVFASIPNADLVSGWSCDLTDRLHPAGYPSAETTAGGTRTLLWARSGIPLTADAIDFGDGYSGSLRLGCEVGLSSGTFTEIRDISVGTQGILGAGPREFQIAYTEDRFGWGAPDFLGLGIVGVMGIMTAMVGFSRKNLPASAVMFAVVIGGFGWAGLMNITEAVMAGITVAVILIVFQRTGGRG